MFKSLRAYCASSKNYIDQPQKSDRILFFYMRPFAIEWPYDNKSMKHTIKHIDTFVLQIEARGYE